MTVIGYLRNKLDCKILEKSELIVLDIADTIMAGGGIYPVIERQGLGEFLNHYKSMGKKIVLYTDHGTDLHHDDSLKSMSEFLIPLGIDIDLDNLNKISPDHTIRKVYFGWDMDGNYKDLAKVMAEFEINDSKKVVMIGDSDKDENSAKKYGVHFIRVPSFIDEIDENINSVPYLIDKFDHYDEIPPDKLFSFSKLIR